MPCFSAFDNFQRLFFATTNGKNYRSLRYNNLRYSATAAWCRARRKCGDAAYGGTAGARLVVGKNLRQKRPENDGGIVKYPALHGISLVKDLFNGFGSQHLRERESGGRREKTDEIVRTGSCKNRLQMRYWT